MRLLTVVSTCALCLSWTSHSIVVADFPGEATQDQELKECQAEAESLLMTQLRSPRMSVLLYSLVKDH